MADFKETDLIAYAIKAEIIFRNGETTQISSEDISRYLPSTTMSSQCIPLGAAAATSYSLTFNNQEYGLTADMLDGAEVRVSASIGKDEQAEWRDLGVWFAEGIDVSEQDPFATISGSDALNSKFNAKWKDTKEDYPRSLLLIAQTMCAIAGVRLSTEQFRNYEYTVKKMPDWGDDATIRDVISHIAVCAAGFARINYSGELEIVTIGASARHTADADYYFKYSEGGKFAFNCFQYQFETDDDEEEEYTRFAVDSSLEDNATNTIQLNGNPLMTSDMANDIAQALRGIAYTGATISWPGGVDVLPGDELELTTLDGAKKLLILNSYSLTLDGGMSSETTSDLPSTISETEYFSNGANAFNPDGSINANAISGLDKKVVSAEIAYFNSLTTETVKTSKLVASLIDAIKLRATVINAESIETDSLTAMLAEIVDATVRKLTAGTITADSLSAGIANITALKISSLTAADIATDRLASALAAFTVITAGTADFDRATVEHLVSKALNLEFGTADEVFINNLRVAYAQLVYAAIGNLVIRASDGNYYRIDVDPSGNVTSVLVSVSEDEIAAGQTDAGRIILATDITAQSLNTSNLMATYALINKIDASRIDVDQLFAREAFISKLQTTDITSNSYIQQSIVDAVNGRIGLFARLDDDGLHIGQAGMDTEVLIDGTSVNVMGGGRRFSKFAGDYAQFGNYQMRRTADGGLAFMTV